MVDQRMMRTHKSECLSGTMPAFPGRTYVTSATPNSISEALAGDPRAIRELVDALTPVVQCRVAKALLRRGASAKGRSIRQEVEDLTQEVFESLFVKDGRVLRTWEPDRGLTLPSFVGLVAERQVASILRSRRRSPWTEDPTEAQSLELDAGRAPGPEKQLASRQMTQELSKRMRHALSPLGFKVFRLLFCEEQTPDAVCSELSMSADAVYAWRSRIRKTARVLAADLHAELMTDGADS